MAIDDYNDDFLYEMLRNRDRRFDGRFFFGTVTTGVYCRPVCPIRRPKRENCVFFESAAKAEKAGFRPCLRCHPEFAPEDGRDPEGPRVVTLAAGFLRGNEELGEGKIPEISDRLGVSERHLRRLFLTHYGVNPVQYAQTQKLLFARKLIFETDLSFTQVAMAANFGSVRRMNALFHERYGCNPTQMRKEKRIEGGDICLRIPYSTPFAWEESLAFLSEGAIDGVEEIVDGEYRRTVAILSKGKRHKGWLAVRNEPQADSLIVKVDEALIPVTSAVVARLKKLFDTDCRPEDVEAVLGASADLCGTDPGIRIPGSFEPFETAIATVLGRSAANRAATLGEVVSTPFASLGRIFPSAGELFERLREKPLSAAPARVAEAEGRILRELAAAATKGVFEPQTDIDDQIAHLAEMQGIGNKAASHIAMRMLDWPDAFTPADDHVMRAYPGASEAEILEKAEAWRPWRAYAAMRLRCRRAGRT